MDERAGMPQAGNLEQRAMTGRNPGTCDQEVSPGGSLELPSRELGDAEPQDERDTAAETPCHGANKRGVKVHQKNRRSKRWSRAATACTSCRRQKMKCSGEQPCQQCRSRGRDCVFRGKRAPEARHALQPPPPPVTRHSDGESFQQDFPTTPGKVGLERAPALYRNQEDMGVEQIDPPTPGTTPGPFPPSPNLLSLGTQCEEFTYRCHSQLCDAWDDATLMTDAAVEGRLSLPSAGVMPTEIPTSPFETTESMAVANSPWPSTPEDDFLAAGPLMSLAGGSNWMDPTLGLDQAPDHALGGYAVETGLFDMNYSATEPGASSFSSARYLIGQGQQTSLALVGGGQEEVCAPHWAQDIAGSTSQTLLGEPDDIELINSQQDSAPYGPSPGTLTGLDSAAPQSDIFDWIQDEGCE